MTRRLDESTARRLHDTLVERFGAPLVEFKSDGQGVPMSDQKKDMGNRGFGAKFEQCTCGGMMELDEDVCTACGMMPAGMEDGDAEAPKLDEKAPPGREKQVKALKKQKGVKNPFAVAWSSYNKRKKK